jgi:hypothetical protein
VPPSAIVEIELAVIILKNELVDRLRSVVVLVD